MAEALLRKHQGARYDVHSAGTDPKEQVHPLAVKVMAEIGIDISSQRPKNIETYLGKQPVKHVIIVCDHANQSCPRTWPGSYTRGFIPFEDPAEARGTEPEQLEVFRRVRDQIDAAMRDWQPRVQHD
jgi:arsenate reductase